MKRLRARLAEIEERALALAAENWADILGVGALLLLASGVWELAGGAWARVVLSLPVAGLYFWLGLRSRLRRG